MKHRNAALAPVLQQRSDIWAANDLPDSAQPGIPSGHPALDAELPGGGWPVGELTEVLSDCQGHGEMSLLLPWMAAASRREGWLVWVSPPARPHLPALAAAGLYTPRLLLIDAERPAERVWALRQALESGACTGLAGWLDKADTAMLRRLQLAARATPLPVLLFRPAHDRQRPSPAGLRLQLSPGPAHALRVDILKRRGRPASTPLYLRTRAFSMPPPLSSPSLPSPAAGPIRRPALTLIA
ncbi:MAG: translesion DNA synthesis-associated protein ImuA [Methyloversatilis sp.]|jgi:protein ImuA|uniref:SOS cell division inhibitor SulA n=1 Tax=Methyloversatilis universalis (strain ATCC BAA-1314 / DSM 25237 / JCM 13912 / CCUG 52030 / FAM5) TaxID=1000565 RepID=F5R986_METUF|nr:translesion DNA synthesis-associated protein ImuA [Methyloversatilis universalis]EGK72877.1 hypothetical protein METUNv1_00706 [Methyloversatilis universalis FAM5]MCP4638521.1 translesion DNA synthesis-associated protein ImuA [Methyloversatilis sp.]